MSYFLSPALFTLRAQIDKRWPRRDRKSDGWIGDASHQARKSDHNPDWSDGGIIRAIDVDRDGVDIDVIIEAFVNDPRARYVIWNRRIRYGKYVSGVPQGWMPYRGSNPHTMHAHFSVRAVGNFDRQERSWNLPGATKPKPKPTPKPKEEPWEYALRHSRLTRSQVRLLQAGLSRVFPAYADLKVDGIFGRKTYNAVREFQKRSGLARDGIVGPRTRSALNKYGIRF